MRYVNMTPSEAASKINRLIAFGDAYIEKIDGQNKTVSVRKQKNKQSKTLKIDLARADMVRRQLIDSGGKGDSVLEIMESIGGEWRISYTSI